MADKKEGERERDNEKPKTKNLLPRKVNWKIKILTFLSCLFFPSFLPFLPVSSFLSMSLDSLAALSFGPMKTQAGKEGQGKEG